MPKLDESRIAEYLAFAHELADAAAQVTLAHFRTRLEVENKKKEFFDPVTRADKGAEAAMRELIARRYPRHGIYGEELGEVRGGEDLTWVIDPIDGTRSFISGNPLWGTLIALSEDDGPLLGILDQPFIGERFWGVRGGGAFYARAGAERALKTRRCAGLAEATLSTTTPEMFAAPDKARAFASLQGQARLLRFGGDCYQYALVALGFLDVVVEAGLKPFDIHALVPIVEGAGGIVTTWDGGSPNQGGNIVAAGDARVHAAVCASLKKALA